MSTCAVSQGTVALCPSHPPPWSPYGAGLACRTSLGGEHGEPGACKSAAEPDGCASGAEADAFTHSGPTFCASALREPRWTHLRSMKRSQAKMRYCGIRRTEVARILQNLGVVTLESRRWSSELPKVAPRSVLRCCRRPLAHNITARYTRQKRSRRWTCANDPDPVDVACLYHRSAGRIADGKVAGWITEASLPPRILTSPFSPSVRNWATEIP